MTASTPKLDYIKTHQINFLSGGGEMGARMRSFDWSRTPLGSPARWPQSLKTIVRVMLDSRYAMWMLWGSEYTFFCNDAYLPTVGLKRDWVLGSRSDKVWQEIWPDIGPRIQQVLEGGEATWDEGLQLFLERSGFPEETYHTFSYSPIYDDDSRIAGMLCVVTEVTDRVIGERRLRVLHDLAARSVSFETTAEACRRICDVLGLYPLDIPFATLYLLDDPRAEAHRACWTRDLPFALAPPLVRLDDDVPLARLMRHDAPQVLDGLPQQGISIDAEPWDDTVQRAFVLPLNSSGQERLAGFLVMGVSPRRAFDDGYRSFLMLIATQAASAIGDAQAYDAERRRAESLAALDRAKTTFFSNISHEFRTPLTLMIGPTEAALASPERALKGEELERVHRNALRLLRLVNALLEFSRIEAGRVQASFEPTDLAQFTRDLGSTFRSAIERAGLELIVDCEPLPHKVYADREMWETVVLNLLSNAFKFTPAGRISVRLRARGEHAVLEVEDTGVGVAASELPRLFERFHRVEGAQGRTHEGSGIGLALVQELVKLHGGSIEASSDVGVGTTFRVLVPFGSAHLDPNCVRENATTQAASRIAGGFVQETLRWLPDAGTTGTLAKESSASNDLLSDLRFSDTFGSRIVLADDNADMRIYVAGLLAPSYVIEMVSDGEQALAAARRDRPDLILSDVMMPHLDGLGLLAAIRADPALTDVPIILLSARAGEDSRIKGLDAGADDYLVKPFSARELTARVGALLERSQVRRASEARLRLGLSSARMVVWDWDLIKGVLTTSDNVRDVFGGEWRDAQSALSMVHPDDRPAYDNALHRAIETRGPFAAEIRIRRPDNAEELWIQVRAQVHCNPGGEAVRVSGVALDIALLKRTEHDLLVASQRKDEFLAMLAHELRNPLAPIRHSSEILARTVTQDARGQAAVSIIKRQIVQLTRLVDDLLDVSRITRGRIELELKTVELGGIVAQAIETVEPLLSEYRHHIRYDTSTRALYVSGDSARLIQCVVNLLTNAAKYTNPEGHIRIEVRADQGDGVIEVIDDGVGIAPELLPQVFDLFVQGERALDRSLGGLGIGLSVVQRLIDMHGGSVVAKSAGAGKGSVFTLRLPLIENRASAAQEVAIPPRTSSRRVLIVDDNVDAADSLATLLMIDGHETDVVYSATQAIERFTAWKPNVVLLDIGLPGMDGYEVVRRLSVLPHRCKFIALTGYGQAEDRHRALESGFDDHLAKPVELDALSKALD